MFCTQKDASEIIPKLPEIYDEPFGDSSAIPTYLLSQFTQKQVKVSLSADAGDEIFCGYNHYQQINSIFQKINRMPALALSLSRQAIKLLSPELLASIIQPIVKYPNLRNKIRKIEKALDEKNSLKEMFTTINSYWLENEIKKLLVIKFSFPETFSDEFEKVKNLDIITQMQAVDYKTYLCSDILTKVDRATMAVGLEGREPFLDQNIIEYVAKLPLNLKYRNGQRKYILRKILRKYIPEKLVERPKKGFSVPIDFWFKKNLEPLLREYLSPQKIKREGIFSEEVVNRELNAYFSDKLVSVNRLWLILMFQLWKEKWLLRKFAFLLIQ